MKQYLKNLITALSGRNPYREDVGELRERYEKTAENVEALRVMYGNLLEAKCLGEDQLREYEQLLSSSEKQLASYQTLVDNLRERITEKDAMMDQMRKDYQQQVRNYEKRVGDYCATIAALQEKADGLADRESRTARGKKKSSKDGGTEKV